MPEAAKPTPLQAQWAVRELRGPKAEVIATLQADPKLPDFVKTFIVAAVQASPAAGVKVDCHGFCPNPETITQSFNVAKLY